MRNEGEDEEGGTAPPKRIGDRDVSLPPLRILVVEDDATNRLFETELVRRLGHQASAAVNGREALEVLARAEFDLVLLDISMPVMGGLKVTERIRRGEVPGCPSDLPIVAMTAHVILGDRERFLGSGMDDYLPKPFEPVELGLLLEKWQTRKAAAEGGLPDGEPPPQA